MTILESPLDTIKHAILTNDIALLVEFPGIGKKTAERLCLELKNKVMDLDTNSSRQKTDSSVGAEGEDINRANKGTTPLCNNDAFDALQSLGYSRLEAHRMIAKVSSEIHTTEGIVREALKVKN